MLSLFGSNQLTGSIPSEIWNLTTLTELGLWGNNLTGEISEVIENLDRSYSIIKVEEFIAPAYIPIKNVYNRIESILKRENQRLAKEVGLKNLHQKYNVIINEEMF